MRIGLKSDESIGDFLNYWVYDTTDQFSFIEKLIKDLGGLEYLHNLKRLEKAEEYLIEDIGVDFSYEPVIPKTE